MFPYQRKLIVLSVPSRANTDISRRSACATFAAAGFFEDAAMAPVNWAFGKGHSRSRQSPGVLNTEDCMMLSPITPALIRPEQIASAISVGFWKRSCLEAGRHLRITELITHVEYPTVSWAMFRAFGCTSRSRVTNQ